MLRGHGRVISWPNFNIVMSQGIERLKERERDGNGQLVNRTHKKHLLIKSDVLYVGLTPQKL